eukprot:TRINITY_DN2619_c0_g1_i1.p1 TRINITY_DN2619_c0_g1~~TRINITY_DN2619_c0_g1_i1.p1  ORF type:complete len:542 (-),score=118.02 TRINITY_DN2619_c0_g1_i1:168-1793(-)
MFDLANNRLILIFSGISFLVWIQFVRTEKPSNGLQKRETIEEFDESTESFSFLVLLSLEIGSFLIGYVLKQNHFKYLHEAGATMLFGAIVGGFIRFLSNVDRLKSIVTFQSSVFFLFLLPPIILESGYNMKRSNFFKNFGGIMAFALVGTSIATFVTGGLIWAVASSGLLWHHVSAIESFLFGSLISATDPVTVLAILKELKVDVDLYSNVFGESVLNDAMAIVLYRTIGGFVCTDLNAKTILWAVGQFLYIFLGSVLCGVVVAIVSALVYKFTNIGKFTTMETCLLSLFAYTSYLLAEGLNMSGIVAILFCGIAMAQYTFKNLSEEAQTLSTKVFEVLAVLSETLVFAYLGLALFSFETEYDPAFIFFAIIIILFARAVQVFPLSFLINLTRSAKRKIRYNFQFFIWFAGLRGGIAFVLALDVKGKCEDGEAVSSTASPPILTTTLIIAFFTVLVLGGATVPLLERLKIPIGVERELPSQHVPSTNPNFFKRFDRKYLKPFLTKVSYRDYAPADPDEIELSDYVPSNEESTELPGMTQEN